MLTTVGLAVLASDFRLGMSTWETLSCLPSFQKGSASLVGGSFSDVAIYIPTRPEQTATRISTPIDGIRLFMVHPLCDSIKLILSS